MSIKVGDIVQCEGYYASFPNYWKWYYNAINFSYRKEVSKRISNSKNK